MRALGISNIPTSPKVVRCGVSGSAFAAIGIESGASMATAAALKCQHERRRLHSDRCGSHSRANSGICTGIDISSPAGSMPDGLLRWQDDQAGQTRRIRSPATVQHRDKRRG
jgi:hypothetical protein